MTAKPSAGANARPGEPPAANVREGTGTNTRTARTAGAPASVLPRMLVLEDEEAMQLIVTQLLAVRGIESAVAATVREARAMLARDRYDIVLTDVRLPDGSGLSLAEDIDRRDTLVIVMTGLRDISTAVEALRSGAVDLITKPFSKDEFLTRVDSAVEQWRSHARLCRKARVLERLAAMKEDEASRSTLRIDEVSDSAVVALGAALNLKDHEARDHCIRVSHNAVALGRALSLSPFELRNLKWGAYLHDIGKIGIPEHLLHSPRPLDLNEQTLMRQHPTMGYTLIRTVDFLRFAADVVQFHHERFDGAGYPHGLRGTQIPAAARIFSVVDTLDAVTTNQPHRAAASFAHAREEIIAQSGRMFDPEVVAAFASLPEQAWRVSGSGEQGDDDAL